MVKVCLTKFNLLIRLSEEEPVRTGLPCYDADHNQIDGVTCTSSSNLPNRHFTIIVVGGFLIFILNIVGYALSDFNRWD